MSQQPAIYNASIVSISEEVKSKSNGKQYLTTRVKFTDGPLANMTYFAQRTLGESKASIHVGQSVKAILNIVEDENGVRRPFFEVSTSMVDDSSSIMAALGL
jgi:hypothetical protein